jgi:hypothetical protein
MILTLRLDVGIEAPELASALDYTKCRCLDGLDFGIENHSQCRSGIQCTCANSPSIRSRDPLYWVVL